MRVERVAVMDLIACIPPVQVRLYEGNRFVFLATEDVITLPIFTRYEPVPFILVATFTANFLQAVCECDVQLFLSQERNDGWSATKGGSFWNFWIWQVFLSLQLH